MNETINPSLTMPKVLLFSVFFRFAGSLSFLAGAWAMSDHTRSGADRREHGYYPISQLTLNRIEN
jgi:hypothetical protein